MRIIHQYALYTRYYGVFRAADKFRLVLFAAYLPGELIVLADMLSRKTQVLKNEWSLGDEAFPWLSRMSPFRPPQVDLFEFLPQPGSQGQVSGRTVDAVAEGSPVCVSASYHFRSFSADG